MRRVKKNNVLCELGTAVASSGYVAPSGQAGANGRRRISIMRTERKGVDYGFARDWSFGDGLRRNGKR